MTKRKNDPDSTGKTKRICLRAGGVGSHQKLQLPTWTFGVDPKTSQIILHRANTYGRTDVRDSDEGSTDSESGHMEIDWDDSK